MALNRDDLVEWLVDENDLDASELTDDTLLFSSGLLDSLSMVDLIGFLEERAGFKVKWNDVNLDNLDSLARILRYAERNA